MNILFIASEFSPFAKSGMLAEFSRAVTVNLVKKGINVYAFLPYYKSVQKQNLRISGKITRIEVELPMDCLKLLPNKKNILGKLKIFDVLPYRFKGVDMYFIKNDYLFGREDIYGQDGKDYEDNLLRFFAFSYASLAFLKESGMKPDLIHANDWQASLVPLLVKFRFKLAVPVLLTMHNLLFQGIFNSEQFSCLGFDDSLFIKDKLEYYGRINLLKGGIRYADFLNTVSKRYASDIKKDGMGSGLEGVLNEKERIYGIVNGVDYDEWSPETDKYIHKNYNRSNVKTGKKSCKRVLLNSLFGKEAAKQGLCKPVLGIFPGNGDSSESAGTVAGITENLIKNGCKIVCLSKEGNKPDTLVSELLKISEKYPEDVFAGSEFDEKLEHKIIAGCDFILMLSNLEPCPSRHISAMKYGTLPIAYQAGCLDDTIVGYDGTNPGSATGFKFFGHDAREIEKTILNVLNIYYNDSKTFFRIILNSMETDFSWENTAGEYVSVYKEILKLI